MNSRLSKSDAVIAPLYPIAALYPVLVLVCEGVIPALKGSAVGLERIIFYADFLSDTFSQAAVLVLLLLGTPSFVPLLLRRSTRWTSLTFLPAGLFAYLIVVGSSRTQVPSGLVATAALSVGLGGLFLLLRNRRAIEDWLPLSLTSFALVVSGVLGVLPDHASGRLQLGLMDLATLAALLSSLALLRVAFRSLGKERLGLAILLVAYPVGAGTLHGHSAANWVGWLARSLATIADSGNVQPTLGGALLLSGLCAAFLGIVRKSPPVMIAAAASLLAILAPTPLGIAAFATVVLRTFIDTADVEGVAS